MLAPVTHILPLTTIRRTRLLPAPGKVLVRAGQKVGPSDVLAETTANADYLLVDIARGLGLPAEKADKHLKVHEGDQLAEKDILAGPVGIFKRVIRCPRDGRVMLAGNGQVLLETLSKPLQIKAGLPGEVVDLVPERGAVVEGTGALIQGVWGNGRLDFGVLTCVARQPEHELQPSDLDVSMRGSIVLAGYGASAEALKTADELPLRGLIFSGVSAALAPQLQRLNIPVIVLEGFGRRAYHPAAFKLLISSDRRELALNADAWNAYSGVRPEVVIPMPPSGLVTPPPESVQFALDQAVRIRRAPYAGAAGVLTAMKGSVVFPGGLRAPAAEVRLENGAKAIIPLANLEVIA
ncbi:MAG: hypothetical protein ACKOC5_15890 [Chloroflexota bacterium]